MMAAKGTKPQFALAPGATVSAGIYRPRLALKDIDMDKETRRDHDSGDRLYQFVLRGYFTAEHEDYMLAVTAMASLSGGAKEVAPEALRRAAGSLQSVGDLAVELTGPLAAITTPRKIIRATGRRPNMHLTSIRRWLLQSQRSRVSILDTRPGVGLVGSTALLAYVTSVGDRDREMIRELMRQGRPMDEAIVEALQLDTEIVVVLSALSAKALYGGYSHVRIMLSERFALPERARLLHSVLCQIVDSGKGPRTLSLDNLVDRVHGTDGVRTAKALGMQRLRTQEAVETICALPGWTLHTMDGRGVDRRVVISRDRCPATTGPVPAPIS